MRDSHGSAHGADTYRDSRDGSTNGAGRRAYPPVEELHAMAASLSLDEHASVRLLIHPHLRKVLRIACADIVRGHS